MSQLKLEIMDSPDAIELLRDDWRRLFAVSGCAPFMSWEWMSSWYRSFGTGHNPLILLAVRDGELVGLVPLQRVETRFLGYTFTRLGFIGEGPGGADYLDVICHRDHCRDVVDTAQGFLFGTSRHDLLRLDSLSTRSELASSLKERFESGRGYSEYITYVCPQVDLREGWPSILENSRRSSNFRRRLKKLELIPGFEHRAVTETDEIGRAFERFLSLHQKRRLASGGSELSGCRELTNFHRDVVATMADSGLLRFEELWTEGECRASVYGFEASDTFYYYNSGLDPEWAAHSVGMVLIGLSIRSATERGLTTFDFLRGDEAYKFDWANQTEQLVTACIVSDRLVARLGSRLAEYRLRLRHLARTVLPIRFTNSLKTKELSTNGSRRPVLRRADGLISQTNARSLSIVIIGRNEERGLARCITAAREAADLAGGAEIIFVDSASTDRSAQIAVALGARVIPMPPKMTLCPSAGRYVGSRHARGEFILFLDADTLIYKDFLEHAMVHFRSDPSLAGVNGWIDDLDEKGERLENIEERYEHVAPTKWLRGPACFYRRRSLDAVGSFDPQVIVEEEAELGLRLVGAGYKLNLIPVPMACHTRCYHWQSFRDSLDAFTRDVRLGRLGEVTRTIATAARTGNAIAFCWLRLKTTLLLVAWLLLLLASLLLPSAFYPTTLFGALLLTGFIAIYIKKRDLRQTVAFVPSKTLVLIDILAGLPKVWFRNDEDRIAVK